MCVRERERGRGREREREIVFVCVSCVFRMYFVRERERERETDETEYFKMDQKGDGLRVCVYVSVCVRDCIYISYLCFIYIVRE